MRPVKVRRSGFQVSIALRLQNRDLRDPRRDDVFFRNVIQVAHVDSASGDRVAANLEFNALLLQEYLIPLSIRFRRPLAVNLPLNELIKATLIGATSSCCWIARVTTQP